NGNWTNLNGQFLQLTQFNGLDVHPFNPFSAVGGSQSNGTELFSDSPFWTVRDGGHGGKVFINNKNPLIVYHVQDNLLRRSLDGGVTWATIASNVFIPLVNPALSPVPSIPAVFPFTVLETSLPRVSVIDFPFVVDRVDPARLLYANNGTLLETANAAAPTPL